MRATEVLPNVTQQTLYTSGRAFDSGLKDSDGLECDDS
jgi:hypothetical protein